MAAAAAGFLPTAAVQKLRLQPGSFSPKMELGMESDLHAASFGNGNELGNSDVLIICFLCMRLLATLVLIVFDLNLLVCGG